jgi:hypothetical protein
MIKVGQNHVYTVYIRQGNHQIYGHIWYIYYTVLANPRYDAVCQYLSDCQWKLRFACRACIGCASFTGMQLFLLDL